MWPELVSPASASAASPRTGRSSRLSWLRCKAWDLRRPLASPPRWELAGHLHREVEVVGRDLLDVHPERHRRTRLGGGRMEMRPQGVRDVERRSSGQAAG